MDRQAAVAEVHPQEATGGLRIGVWDLAVTTAVATVDGGAAESRGWWRWRCLSAVGQ